MLLYRDGSRSTTTPSTSTVTSGTECRPQSRSARCHPAAHKHGVRIHAGQGRRILTRVGCTLFRQWRFSADRRHAAGRLRRNHSGRPAGRTTSATAVRAGAGCAPFAGGVTLPSADGRAARPLRLSSGQGHAAPCSPEESSASGPTRADILYRKNI